MENPVTHIREELGLSRRQLCHAVGTRLDSLYLVESGLICRPQQRLLSFLASVGYDPETIVADYKEYREVLKGKVVARLENRDNRRPAND